jgi:LAO/AO transport system kinase
LHIVRPRTPAWAPRVLTCSALLGAGIGAVWDAVGEYRTATAGELPARRADQARDWMWSEVTDALLDDLRGDARVAGLARSLEADVAAGVTTPTAAAQRLLAEFRSSP